MTPYYADDHVTLYHARWEDVPPDLLRADVLVTDPPYGLGSLMGGGGDAKWPLWDPSPEGLAWDGSAPDITALVAPFGQAIVWGGNYFTLPPARGWLVWDKIVREFSTGHAELAWTNLPQPVKAYSYAHGQLANEGKEHPTQKPQPLMRWCIGMTTGTILDPYAGSGTTLVAAKSLGRKAIGVECVERYCEVAANRLRQEVLGLAS